MNSTVNIVLTLLTPVKPKLLLELDKYDFDWLRSINEGFTKSTANFKKPLKGKEHPDFII